MKEYVGTKVIHAEKMTEYQWHRIGRHLVSNPEEPEEKDIQGYHVIDDNGISFWSPKETFEKAYHEFLSDSRALSTTVYPSEERTVFSADDPKYGGGHRYQFMESLGFTSGGSIYEQSRQEIHFVQKNEDGTMTPGLQSEQIIIALIDRHKKLNAQYPSAQNERMITGLQIFLDACKARIQDRIARNVMGDLKK